MIKKTVKKTAKKVANKPVKKGRPKLEFDLKRVEDMASCHATYQELADAFGCHYDTISSLMKDDKSSFFGAYKKGMTRFKNGLRRKQLECANQLNATMLIWLGKNYLDQSDLKEIEGESQTGNTYELIIREKTKRD
jgi:hypothetical protein